MRNLITLMLVLLVSACGGGGGDGGGNSSAPTLRFDGVYTATGETRTLSIRPLDSAATIGNNAVARVDVLINDESTLSLAAPSRVDATGRGEYVFDIPAVAGGLAASARQTCRCASRSPT